jgi:hypothetical protein
MNFATNKKRNDKPAPGHALLERLTHSYRRSINGAWMGNGCTSEMFEIPLDYLNSPEGANWLNPSHDCVLITFPDGNTLSIDTTNVPIRGYGLGDFGTIEINGKRETVTLPHPLLPNIARTYYRMRWFSNAELATFKPYES